MKNKYLQDHSRTKKILKVIGFTALPLGGILGVVGLIDFFEGFSPSGGNFSNPYHFPEPEGPDLFYLIFIGMALVFIGLACLSYAYMGKVARYTSSEMAPVVKDTANYLIDGTKNEVAGLVSKIKNNLLICPYCGDSNDLDSIYCDACGNKITKKCLCGQENNADSKYCKKCGREL